jgi:hypothetical protein
MREIPLFQRPAAGAVAATPWWISLAILFPRVLDHLIRVLL